MDGEGAPGGSGLLARLRAMLGDSSDASLTKRLAGTIFIIRVLSAGLAYFSQVLLARWMGTSEYGIYVYAWTWVLLLGSMMDFGIADHGAETDPGISRQEPAQSAARLPVRQPLADLRRVRRHLMPARGPGLPAVAMDRGAYGHSLYIGCTILPALVLANVQDGIARSHDWMRLALSPQFIVRQSLIIGFTAGAFALGARLDAVDAMKFSSAAVWIAMIAQMVFLNRRLKGAVEPGPRHYAYKSWLATSLPILLVEGFYLLLSYVDILVLQAFRPSDDVGIYHAIVKTLALVSFIHYAMAATTAHRFSEYHVAGDRERLSAYLAHAIKWTFWPSLAATALLLAFGKPLLWLFGPQFTSGYAAMFVVAIGLIARSAMGPVERLLNMLGHQNVCAFAYALAFVMNLVLCILLVPRYGIYGAAASTSIALVFESILLFWITRKRLGFHVLAFGKGRAG